jgi:hypothetical protein
MNGRSDAIVAIGVTGHRQFEVADASQRIDRLLDDIIGDRRPLVVSSLAEGADRLVVELVLSRPGARLTAVLPMAPDEYEHDFDGPGSVAEFRRLLAKAESVSVADVDAHATRDQAYEVAGRSVVELCDILIAVWDSAASRGRGGTAEIVEHARRVGRRVEVVAVMRHAPS